MQWTVIIPVKPAATGKSRLGLGPQLARAIALDTVAAAIACTVVERVLVVTSDPNFRSPDVEVVAEDAPAGIDAAVRSGAALASGSARAALLGDLPALRPEDLAAALDAAAFSSRAFVPDHEGTGTTLVTAVSGVELLTAFGVDSAARHRALGLVELRLAADSTATMDVDTREQLEIARGFGVGPATRAVLARRSVLDPSPG